MSKISKYFKVLNENVSTDLKNNSDSPYKNVLTNIKAVDLNSLNESSDFKTPKPLPKAKPKVLPKQSNSKKVSARRNLSKTKKTSPVKAKAIKEDCDLEHLQMAIALSKSLQTEDDGEKDECFNKSTTNEQKVSLLDKLQQYKFQSGTSKLRPQNCRKFSEKKRGKSKLKYIRPVLLLRTQEDRERITSNKISLILSSNTNRSKTREIVNEKPSSKLLQKYYSHERKIFIKSKYSDETPLNDFYVDALKIEHRSVRCGSLLKNWHEIPGRPISPILTITNTEIQPDLQILDSSRCTSPDLFDSEDEVLQETAIKSPILKSTFSKPQDVCTQRSDTDSKLNATSFREPLETSISDEYIENENGICVFESFSNQSLCVDLTQSSDDSGPQVKHSSLKTGVTEAFEKSISLASDDSGPEINHSSLKTGVTEAFEKSISLASDDDTIDYVNKLLEEEKLNNCNFRKTVKLGDDYEDLYCKEINLSYIACAGTSEKCVKLCDLTQNLDTSELSSRKNDSVTAEVNFSLRKSQSSNSTNSEESICISDDEVNYSCLRNTPTHAQRKRRLSKKGSFYSLSDSDSSDTNDVNEVNEEECSSASSIETPSDEINNSSTPKVIGVDNELCSEPETSSSSKNIDVDNTVLYEIANKEEENVDSEVDTSVTPNPKVVMKTSNVTPMANYNEMNTPTIVGELAKFGLKPLKRQRGVQLLKYIYESTHPLVNTTDDSIEDDNRNKKKRKVVYNSKPEEVTSASSNYEKNITSTQSIIIGKNILGPNEELIFERKHSKRVLSCMVPLQIAWHNLVTSDQDLQKKILLYEPLQLEDLYRTLKSHGYKYHIQDLLTFLDRKCITIRTEQTSRSRHKKSRTQLFPDQS